MKKIIVIILCLMIIIATSTIGYVAVSANTQVDIEKNIVDKQNELQTEFKSYGYTLDNPNIIINPYEISPLTALIIFETDTKEEISLTVCGKTEETTYTNKFEESKVHYIPIYGLYPDYENKIIINTKNKQKEYIIKTEKLPEDLTITNKNEQNKLLFTTTDNYTYALDQNNEIRWYLTKKYTKKISNLENGNFLLSSDKLDENNNHTSLVEIDLLGRIYKEYKIKTGYYGSYIELDKTILVLSKNLLEIDKQTGTIIKEIPLDEKYDTITYENNELILSNNKISIKINKNTLEMVKIETENLDNQYQKYTNFYNNNKDYLILTGISFDIKQKTKTSNKNIFLINYKKIDKYYKNYNIKLKKETDRLVISGNFEKDDKVYIILDKFLDKKVYNVKIKNKKTYKYINKEGLSGKYSIYIKINENLYKTNKFVTF